MVTGRGFCIPRFYHNDQPDMWGRVGIICPCFDDILFQKVGGKKISPMPYYAYIYTIHSFVLHVYDLPRELVYTH